MKSVTVSPRTKLLEICLNASRKFLWYRGSLEIRPHRVSLMLQMTSKVQSGTKKRISHVPSAILKVHDTMCGGTDGRDRCRGVEGGGFFVSDSQLLKPAQKSSNNCKGLRIQSTEIPLLRMWISGGKSLAQRHEKKSQCFKDRYTPSPPS